MKWKPGLPVVLIPILLVSAAAFSTAGDVPRVSRAAIVSAEKSFDGMISRLWDDNPLALLGSTRGLYLDGYGVVLTAEVNPVIGGTTLMHPTWTKEDKDKHRKKKLERIPQLRNAMKQALMSTAASLDPVPADEQIVIAVYLSRYPWEDSTGIPLQLTMQAQKKKLLEAMRANGAGLDQIITVKEF